jgi:hypothetical protein
VANNYSVDNPPPVPEAVAALPKLTVWSAETLKQQLASARESERLRALAMCTLPNAPINDCVGELHTCVEKTLAANADALTLQLCAVALGTLAPERANEQTNQLLAQLAAKDDETTKTHAAHAFFRLKRMPDIAHAPIVEMLGHPTANVRKVANLSLTPFALYTAAAIVEAVSQTPATSWTTEMLDALAKSCDGDAARTRTVEEFLIRGVKDQSLVPVGIAVFSALARMNPGGQGLTSLVTAASQTEDAKAANAAIEALSALGRGARDARRGIAQLLETCDDPAREEALCRLLVGLETQANELPAARIVERVASAPDRATAAHCMLVSFHAKEFRLAAQVVKDRFAKASNALRPVLAATYLSLTGQPIAPEASATLPKPSAS